MLFGCYSLALMIREDRYEYLSFKRSLKYSSGHCVRNIRNQQLNVIHCCSLEKAEVLET